MRVDVDLSHRDVEAELAALHARMQRPGDVLHGLPAIASPCADIVLRYREADGEFHVYVEDRARDKLAGCTVFNRVLELDRHAGRHLRSPHSRYAEGYRRRGLATAVYQWALDSGLSLVSGPRQSPAAHRLWQALARTHAFAFVRIDCKRLRVLGSGVDERDIEDYDTRMLLLGAGRTLQVSPERELPGADDASPLPAAGVAAGYGFRLPHLRGAMRDLAAEAVSA